MDIELFFTNAKLFRSTASPFRPEFWSRGLDNIVVFGNEYAFGPALLLLACLAAIAAALLIMVSQIGLIDAFATFGKTKRKTKKRYTLGDAIDASHGKVGRVFLMNVLGKGISYALIALVALPLFMKNAPAVSLVYMLLMFCIVTPITIGISIVTKFAVNDIVLQKTTVRDALSNGMMLLRTNPGVSIELAVFMFIAFFLMTVFAIVSSVIITLPLAALTSAFVSDVLVATFIYNIALYVALIILTLVYAMIFSTWHFGNWTLLYLELTKGAKRSKIHRILKG